MIQARGADSRGRRGPSSRSPHAARSRWNFERWLLVTRRPSGFILVLFFLRVCTSDREGARRADARAPRVGLRSPDSGVIVPSASDWHRGEPAFLRAPGVHPPVNTLFAPITAFVLLFTLREVYGFRV